MIETKTRVIEELSHNPDLAVAFAKPASVGEGYTIQEHSKRVLEIFYAKFAPLSSVQELLHRTGFTESSFATFLALHEIGKGLATERHGFTATKERKQDELTTSQEMLGRYFPKAPAAALPLLADDSVKDYFKTEEEGINQIIQSLRSGALEADLSVEEFTELKLLFHRINSSSDTCILAQDQKLICLQEVLRPSAEKAIIVAARRLGIDHSSMAESDLSLEKKLELFSLRQPKENASPPSVSPQDVLGTLASLVEQPVSHLFKRQLPPYEPTSEAMKTFKLEAQRKQGPELYKFVSTMFWSHLLSLKDFFNAKAQEVIKAPLTEEERLKFKQMSQQVRTLLLFCMCYERPTNRRWESPQKAYQKYLDEAFEWNSSRLPGDCFTELPSEKSESAFNLHYFLNAFSDYRKHALIRLFPKKIEQYSKCTDVAIQTLLSLTWCHGTRAVTSLGETHFTLIPTGWLHQMGYLSFFGEMDVGIAPTTGINTKALSGHRLNRVNKCVSDYAQQYQFDIQKELDVIDAFLKIEFDKDCIEKQHSFGGSIKRPRRLYSYITTELCRQSIPLARTVIALKRVAKWNPNLLKEKMDPLLKQIRFFAQIIHKIEDLQPDEIFQWKNDSYVQLYKNVVSALVSIQKFLESPLPPPLTPEQKAIIADNFPAVLGSRTLFGHPKSFEHVVYGTAKLGEDIQVLCVEMDSVERAKKWVEENSLSLEVFSFGQLEEARKAYLVLSPYLADILSVKKLSRCPSLFATLFQTL